MELDLPYESVFIGRWVSQTIDPALKLRLGSQMETINKRINQNAFFARLARSVAVLCMPGLGYDTYRLSETLLLG